MLNRTLLRSKPMRYQATQLIFDGTISTGLLVGLVVHAELERFEV